METYRLIPAADPVAWNRFVNESPEGTIFSLHEYLEATGRRYSCSYLAKGDEIKAALALMLSPDGSSCVRDELVIHGGLIYRPHGDSAVPARVSRLRFALADAAAKLLVREHKRVELSLAPQLTDIRPFLWHNYHADDPGAFRFRCDVRFTSYLDISTLRGDEFRSECFQSMDELRRRSVRKARRVAARAEPSEDLDILLELYRRTFDRQGLDNPSLRDRMLRIERICRALRDQQLGRLFVVREPRGSPVSAAFFGWDRKRAYYLFGGNDVEGGESFSGTLVFWEAFRSLAAMGFGEVDLEGVNSPSRGHFKLSFGGSLRPYYHLTYPS